VGRRREPERTCVGCRERAPKGSLLRIVRGLDGSVRVDPSGAAPGRGAYVHRALGCARQAVGRGALARALRTGLSKEEAATLGADIEREVGQ